MAYTEGTGTDREAGDANYNAMGAYGQAMSDANKGGQGAPDGGGDDASDRYDADPSSVVPDKTANSVSEDVSGAHGAGKDTGDGSGAAATTDEENKDTSDDTKELTADEKARAAAETAAMGAQSRAMGAAQAGGLSAAAGANAGAQAGTEAYSSVYPQTALGYSDQDTQQKIAQMQKDWEMAKADSDQTGTWAQAGSSLIPWLINLISSDETKKTDIRDGHGMLDAVADSVRGKTFSYKDSPGRKEYGIMAQDLEKTPLSDSVVDTPGGKMVDTKRITMANTGMITELSKKLDKVMDYIGRQK